MERNLQVAAPIAGGAVVISLIVGLFAGVPFGTALVRAVVSGAAFGLLSFGAALVARTQLPGFDGSSAPPDSAPPDSAAEERGGASGPADEQGAGSRLNIVVEDDDGPADAADTAEEPDAAAEQEASTAPEAAQAARSAEPASTANGTTDTAPSPGSVSAGSPDDGDEDAEDLVEEVEESSADDEEAVMKAAISEEQDGTSVEIDDTMLDEMPDIGSFAGSFVSGEDSESDETGDVMGGSGDAGGGSDGTKQKKGDPRKGFDNKSIAKALQTFMAKDTE